MNIKICPSALSDSFLLEMKLEMKWIEWKFSSLSSKTEEIILYSRCASALPRDKVDLLNCNSIPVTRLSWVRIKEMYQTT